LTVVPQKYTIAYKFYTKLGLRVLALAYKTMQFETEITDFSKVDRSAVEKDLIFCGFYICDSPLKRDSAKHIKILKEAAY
jgi:cation-transporting ATPase 13A1